MRRNYIHNALPAIFMLMVFTAPLVIKNLHHHVNSRAISYASSSQKSFSESVNPCLICSFASENSISKTSERFIFIQDTNAVCINPDIEIPVKPRFEYFLLRAPPYYS